MSVDTNTVRHIARLARIAVSDTEGEALAPELSNILAWIEQLQEGDVSGGAPPPPNFSTFAGGAEQPQEVAVAGVEPMTAVIPNKLRLRDDVVTEGDRQAEILANAPPAEHGVFAVPKVIE